MVPRFFALLLLQKFLKPKILDFAISIFFAAIAARLQLLRIT